MMIHLKIARIPERFHLIMPIAGEQSPYIDSCPHFPYKIKNLAFSCFTP